MLKANVDFMYYPGFRAFFLTFVGTLMWRETLGIVISCFCFLGAIFNFYVMKTHPAFGHSSNVDDYAPPVPQGGMAGQADFGETDQYGNAKL